MKKYKYLAGVFLVTIVIVPSITFASWWNPFTWFHFSKVEVETIQVATSTTPVTATTTSTTTTQSTIKNNPLVSTTTKNIPAQVATPVVPNIDLNQVCLNTCGINCVWNGTPSNSEGNKICSCKTGYQWNEGQTQCVPYGTVPRAQSVEEITATMRQELLKELKEKQSQSDASYSHYDEPSLSKWKFNANELNAIDCAYDSRNCPVIDVRIINR